VQSVFDHPILFGLCTAGVFALVHLVLGYQKSLFQRTFRTGVVGATSILSLSAGPIIAIVAQGLLLSWNGLLSTIKIRWKILIGLLVLIALPFELFANRSLPEIVSSYFTFDEQSYWFRILIWHYGSASALNHPLFGVGMNEWERPEWMPPSIDNHYLKDAVLYGLPAPFFMLLAFFSIVLRVSLRKGFDDRIIAYRTGFVISMTGFFLVGWTVSFWNSAYVVFFFLLGSGVWMLDVETKEEPTCGRGVRGGP
jgi:MFS family permease